MTQKPIEFEVDGLKLRGNLYFPGAPKKSAVLFIHGWTGHPNEAAAERLANNGFSSMTFSLSGHNDSEGSIEDVTRQKSLNEVVAAYDFFKARLPNDAKICVAGSSYGSYLAMLLSEQRAVAALSLRVPANYPDEHFTDPQAPQVPDYISNPAVIRWRETALDNKATKSLRSLHNFHGPIQIIEAEKDELLPHQTMQNYIDAVEEKSQLDYHFMKGWPHSLGDDPKRNIQYQKTLLNWLIQIASGK